MNELPLRKLLDQFLEQNPSQWEWETRGQSASANKDFFKWLDYEGWTVKDLDAVRMRRFIAHMLKNRYNHHRRWKTRMCVFRFLKWLYERDYPMRNPEELLPYQKPRTEMLDVELPKLALQFLEVMSTRIKPSTLRTHKTACKHFYRFLKAEGLELKTINRAHMEKFFKYLLDQQQAPSTRLSNIIVVRIYLEWLKEKREIKAQPIKIITSHDYPRVPEYLPRPLQPDIDRLVQKRLAASNDLLHRGLLLMRWTGVRVGELSRLTYECVHSDIHGHKFLKVPLGKLDNERLVPLDDKAVKLVGIIKRQTRSRFHHDPPYLLSEKTLKPPATHLIMNALREVCEGVKTDAPIVSHRLRHTYATELLSAGMNICALKEALGHRDIKMTLRYAAITQEKVRSEYFQALQRMKDGSPAEEALFGSITNDQDYNVMLADLISKLKKNAAKAGVSATKLEHLIKRVRRLKDDIQSVI